MRYSRLITAAAMVLALFAAAQAGAADLKIATVLPENTQWMKDMRAGAAEIRERTDGRVNFKFYSGGVQGNPNKVLRKIKIGQLHGGAFTPTDLQQVYPDLNIYGLPFLFESVEEVNYVRERVDPILMEGLEEAGFVSFGFSSGGFAIIMSNVPVRSHADLKGRKIWVPEGDLISYETMKGLQLSPVTLPITDVLTGLQTGLIDIVAMSPAGALVLQWHTKVEYLTKLPILYSMGFMAIDDRAFNRIDEADQAVVRDVMSRIYAEWDAENQQDADNALQALIKSGIEAVEPAPGEQEKLQGLMKRQNRIMAGKGLFSESLLEEVLTHINTYRSEFDSDESVAAH
ncbi:MAG TPA: TRAP transporter substrate-binding protein DctP [Woeseiaceae bacterium]|nr:TRAP transporter substrate-binding protein DctP [Woeseiaceae bacterium]